jgi:integrase
MLDDFILQLRKAKTGAKTINHILTTVKAVFGFADKTGLLETNPAEGIKPFKITSMEKGVFTKEELTLLFSNPEHSGIWTSPMHFLLNYIAAATGLRLGEILALRPENVTDTKISVEYSWNRIEGLKGTKTGKKRIAPIPPGLATTVNNYIVAHNITSFIFSANKGRTPIDHKAVYKHFWSALKKSGIDYESRNITFHSYRHSFNTMLLEAGINPETIRLITGHSANMTARYSHIQLGNMPEIIEKLSVINQPALITTNLV